jgi:DivIVA domain-containing protein
MEWFIAVVVVAILGVAAMAAAGGMGEMAREPVRDTYRQDLPVARPLAADDLRALRFGVTLRGYSMAQVDEVLDRLIREVAERDDRIAALTGAPAPQAGSYDGDDTVESAHRSDPIPSEEHR